MDGRRQGTARRMVTVVRYRARRAAAHRPVAVQAGQGERLGAADRHRQPGFDLRVCRALDALYRKRPAGEPLPLYRSDTSLSKAPGLTEIT